jgi:hypothetical protein
LDSQRIPGIVKRLNDEEGKEEEEEAVRMDPWMMALIVVFPHSSFISFSFSSHCVKI